MLHDQQAQAGCEVSIAFLQRIADTKKIAVAPPDMNRGRISLSLSACVHVCDGDRALLQAPSNMTGLSEGGMAVSSMPNGPAPSQARPPGTTGWQMPPSLQSQPHESCGATPLKQTPLRTQCRLKAVGKSMA
jgi:hypothetical protein